MHPLWIVLIVVAVLLLLLTIMFKPRNQVNTDWEPFQSYVYAHRGFHNIKNGIPENSLAAFARAVESGYGIELDVQLSADRVPVVFHDFDLKRMCGVDARVSSYTYEQLKELKLADTDQKIPTLEEVLTLVDGKVPLIIEYKVEGIDFSVCPISNALLKNYQGLYMVESFNPIVLSWYRSNRNDVVRGRLSDGKLMMNGTTRPDFIAFNHEKSGNVWFLLTTQFFKAKPVAWTVRSQVELDKAKADFDIFIFEGFTPNNRSVKTIDKK